jgi:hypothetical protein
MRAKGPLLIALLSLTASAQVICALGTGAASYKPSEDRRPTSDAMQLAGRVNAAGKTICGTHCPAVEVFRNATAANAMLVAEGSQAKLIYAPAFFASVNENFGDAGVVAVIAHILGHGLDDVLGAAWIKNSWSPELRADAWAGCTLAKSDLSASEMEKALAALAKYPPVVASQPSWSVRLPVIRAGYSQCGGRGSAK